MAASAFTFPYKYKYIKEGKIFDPFVSLPIKTVFGWQPLWFLLDSGADTTMLTVPLANQLKLPYKRSSKLKIYGIGEIGMNAYMGEITLKIGEQMFDVRSYFIDAPDSTLLLGRLDLFDKFNILFNAEKKQIEFSSIPKSV